MISVVVATFGNQDWNCMGNKTFATLDEQTVKPTSTHRVHGKTLAQARNRGAEEAEGEWLLFLDADDHLDSKFIQEMEQTIKKHNNGNYLIRPSILLSDEDCAPYVLPQRNLCEANFMIVGTLVKKKTFMKAGGFNELPVLEDWDLWIRCHYDYGAEFASCRGAVYHITVNEDSRNKAPIPLQMKTYNEIRRTYGFI